MVTRKNSEAGKRKCYGAEFKGYVALEAIHVEMTATELVGISRSARYGPSKAESSLNLVMSNQNRRAVHGDAVLRQSSDEAPAQPRLLCRAQARPATDGRMGINAGRQLKRSTVLLPEHCKYPYPLRDMVTERPLSALGGRVPVEAHQGPDLRAAA